MATVQTLHHRPEMRVSLRFGAVVMMILGGCLLTPALLPTGSVPELSARANAFDYATYDGLWSLGNRDNSPLEWGHDQPEHGLFRWSDAGLIGGIFYAIGDLNCHQKHERSHMVNGNQIPMCARTLASSQVFSWERSSSVVVGTIVGPARIRSSRSYRSPC